MDRDDIMTSEAVLLDANAASFAARMLGALLDLLALGLILLAILASASRAISFGEDSAAFAAFAGIVTLVVFLVIPATVETCTRGRSPGKLALGYRIIRDDGGPIAGREAFVRALVGMFELWMTAGAIAIISTIVSRRGKRLGDYLAGTYAVRVRSAKAKPLLVAMPPELAVWASTADIVRLPDLIALRARMLLSRPASFSPDVAQRLADEIAREVAPFVSPAPPPGTPSAPFLAAVLVERGRREALIGSRRAERAKTLLHNTAALAYGVDDPPI